MLDRLREALRKISRTDLRLGVGLAGLATFMVGIMFVACGACGHPAQSGDTSAPRASASASTSATPAKVAPAPDAAALRDAMLWKGAASGETEDLATLAAHEGAMGLVEAAEDPALRAVAIRAMGFARGWAQLPYLARTAGSKEEDHARAALDATIDLAARPRRAEDPEDSDELREGCDVLGALARDPQRARPRRIAAIRALRMLPCPPTKTELPTDLDAK